MVDAAFCPYFGGERRFAAAAGRLVSRVESNDSIKETVRLKEKHYCRPLENENFLALPLNTCFFGHVFVLFNCYLEKAHFSSQACFSLISFIYKPFDKRLGLTATGGSYSKAKLIINPSLTRHGLFFKNTKGGGVGLE